MAVRAWVDDHALDVSIQGWFDVTMCASTGLRIPLAEVTRARVVTWDEARAEMGWRTFGAYVPGLIATGWYAMPGRKGDRQFWAVHRRRDQLLMVDTARSRPCRLVLAVPDAAAIVDRLAPAKEP